MIIGDLNAHYDCNNLSRTGFCNHFNHWLQCNALYQIIREPTRVTETTSTILDVVITNCPRYFSDSGTCSPPSNCDHSYIYTKMKIPYYKQKSSKRHILDFSNVNIAQLNEELSNLN